METEADTPEFTCAVETAETKELGSNQFDNTRSKTSLGELQKVEEGPTLAPESSAKPEAGVAQYAKNEDVKPVIEDKVGISEGVSFLEAPSLAKFALQETCQASEDPSKQEKPSPKEKETLKKETQLQVDQTDKSVEVTDALTEGGKIDTCSKQVPLDNNWKNVTPEDEQLAKSSELFTEEKNDKSLEVTDGLTESDMVDTSGKQVPAGMNRENVNPENEEVEKSPEFVTEEKNVGHVRRELFSSLIPSTLDTPDQQELETLDSNDEVIGQKKQNAVESADYKQAVIEENLQRGDIMHPHLLKSSETTNDEPMLEVTHATQSLEEEKAVNMQRDEMDGKKSCEDLDLEPRNDTPQTVEATGLGNDQEILSPTPDLVEQNLKTDEVVGESEKMEEIVERSVKQESCNKEESRVKNLGIKDEPIESDLSELSFQKEKLESTIQEISCNQVGMEKGLETVSKTENIENKINEENENPKESHSNSSAEASLNIQNSKAENMENDGSTSDKQDTPVTIDMEEIGHQKAETEESVTPDCMTYSLESQEVNEKNMNDECLLEDEIQKENIERGETRDEEVPAQTQQSQIPILAKLETAISGSNDKVEACEKEDRPAKNLEKSIEEERNGVPTNNCNDNREDGDQKEQHLNQDDSVGKSEMKEVESPDKCSDDMPVTSPLIGKNVEEEGSKQEEISIIEMEEEIHTNNGEDAKELIVESGQASKRDRTANIEHEKEGTPATEWIQTRENESRELETTGEVDSKEEVFEGLEIAGAGDETANNTINEEVVTSLFRTSIGEETANEHSQEVEVNESSNTSGEGEPAEKQVIEDVAATGISIISAGEETVKGSYKDDKVKSDKVCEGIERNSASKEVEKQIMKGGAAKYHSTVFAAEETNKESSQEDEEEAKKHEEKVKKPEEASVEIILEATESTEGTEMMATSGEEEPNNNHNVSNVTEISEEETTQTESSEKFANASFLASEVSKGQVKEHNLEEDENTNDKPNTTSITSITGETSLHASEQEGKAEEEIKHDIPVAASPTVQSEGLETITNSEITCTKAPADNEAEDEPMGSSIQASKEREFKLIKENEITKCERLPEDEIQDEDLETPLVEQIKEEVSMQKEEPKNLMEANKMGYEADKENPNEKSQKAGENSQYIETLNAIDKDVSEQSSQKDVSEVKSLGQLATAASSANDEENTSLKEQGSLENLEESFEKGRKDDEGRYIDDTSKTETQTAEVVGFPDTATMEQNLKAFELCEKIECTVVKDQNEQADDLSISHILVEESVKEVSEKHKEVSDVKPEEEIHKEEEDRTPPDVEELTLETTEMSKNTETANSEHGKTIEVVMSEAIQTRETECMELTNINELDSNDKLKDSDPRDNREAMRRSMEQTADTDLHKKETEDGDTKERTTEGESDNNTVQKDQKIVEKPLAELKEKDHTCETIDAEYSKMNVIQKEEVHDDLKIINALDNTENVKEEISAIKDIFLVSIGRETINESSKDKKEEKICGKEAPEGLEVTGLSTDREQETTEDHGTIKDHPALCTGEEAVTQTYLDYEKEVENYKKVFAGPQTAGTDQVIRKQIIEDDSTLKAHYTVSTGEEIIIEQSQEDEKEEMHKTEVFQEIEKTGNEEHTSTQIVEHGNATDTLTTAIVEEATKTSTEKEEVISTINLEFKVHERIDAANEDEAHGSIEVEPIAGEPKDSVGELMANDNSPEDEACERFKPTSAGQDSGPPIMDDEAIIDFKMMSVREQTITEKPKEDEEEARRQGEVKESELRSTEDFEVTGTIKETDSAISNNGETSNKNTSAFSTVIPLGEELIHKESSLKLSESEEHNKEEILEKADDTSNACPSAPVTIVTENLSLQEAEPESGKQVKASSLASNETSLAQIVASESGSASLLTETIKLEETLNLGKSVTNETPTAGKSDAYKVEEKMPAGALALDQKIKATSGIEITDTNVIESEKLQESSMLVSKNQELGLINMDMAIKDETPLENEIQDEKLETPSVAQIKEEMMMQTEEPSKLKEGPSMGSEDTGKERLLPDSGREICLSKPKDRDTILDMENTNEMTDLSEDTYNSLQCLEKNNSEGEQQFNPLSKDLETVVTVTDVYFKEKSENVQDSSMLVSQKQELRSIDMNMTIKDEAPLENAIQDEKLETPSVAEINEEMMMQAEKPSKLKERPSLGSEDTGKERLLPESGHEIHLSKPKDSDTMLDMENTNEMTDFSEDRYNSLQCLEKNNSEDEQKFNPLSKDLETQVTDTDVYFNKKSENVQDSSMLVSQEQELGSIGIDATIKDETTLENTIQEEKLETPLAAQIKEEMIMQAEEPSKLKEGPSMGSEDTGKESLLPASDHEKHTSKSKDNDAALDMERTAELSDFRGDRQLDNSSQCPEKNNSEGEQQLNPLSKELQQADVWNNAEKDILGNVENHNKSHEHSFKDDGNECNNIQCIPAEAETEDHGCQSHDTIATSNIKKNDTLAQNLEASVTGEKPKGCSESVAEDKGHEKFSITEDVRDISKDWETSSVEDQMAEQSFQNEVSEEIEKSPENEKVEKQIIEEEKNAKHLVEDETSKEESSMLPPKNEEPGTTDMDGRLNDETPLEHEIQNEELEAPSVAQIKEEMMIQAEEPSKLKEGLCMGSEETGKESQLPDLDHEKDISKSKDTDAALCMEKTAELTDFRGDRELDSSSLCLEKNNSEGEQQLTPLSKEFEEVDACTNVERDIPGNVENHTKSHDHSFKDDRDNCNNVEYILAEAKTEDHGCESCDTIITSNSEKNDDLTQTLRASVIQEKPKSHTESVAEDQVHEKLPFIEEVGKVTKNWEISSIDDQMAGQSFQNEGSEGTGKFFENEKVEKQIIEEERNSTHQVEDEISNEAHNSDIASPTRNFEPTDFTKKKERDTLGEKKPEASTVAEVSGQEMLREGNFEKLTQASSLVSKSSEGKGILKEEVDNVYKLDVESGTVMAKETKSHEAEPEGETILKASGIDFEEKRVETFETSVKGEKDETVQLEISSLVSQIPKLDKNIDQRILMVEKMDMSDVGSTVEMQTDAQEKDKQVKNIEEVPNKERRADEFSFHNTAENENSKDENAEAVNPGENIKTKDIETHEKFTNELPITNSLVEDILVGKVETNCEEAPNCESEKLEKALGSVPQVHLQVSDIIMKETGNKEDESMVEGQDIGIDSSLGKSFQEDKKTDRQLKEAESTVEAEQNQGERINKGNETIQKEILPEEASKELESAMGIEKTAQQISEREEDIEDPCLILGGKIAKPEPEDQIHEQEVEEIQIVKTNEAEDTISFEEVQKELENSGANENIEQQIKVGKGPIRDPIFVTVGEETVQKNHQKDEMNKEVAKIAPVEFKPEEQSAKLVSEEDKDVKMDETNLTLEKGIINKDTKEVSEGLEKAGAHEDIARPIAEEKEAFKDPYLLHVEEEKIEEIQQEEDLKTLKVEDEAPKLNSEYQNQEESRRNRNTENEEINGSALLVEMLELETAGSSHKTELVTVKDDKGLSKKFDDPPIESAASKEVPGEATKEPLELSELVHEGIINEIIITNALGTEKTSEDTDALEGLTEPEKLKSTSDLECSSTGELKDVINKEETPINSPGASFPNESKQQKIPEIEGKIMEGEERQDLAFARQAISDVSLTKEVREDNNKHKAPVDETLQNEVHAQDVLCENEEQRNQISEQEDTSHNIELLKKASDMVDEEYTTRAADSTEIIERKISTASIGIQSKPKDPIAKASEEAEVEYQEPAEGSRIESEVKGLQCDGEKRVQDASKETMADSYPSDSDKLSLSDLLQRPTKEKFQIVSVEERDPLAKNEETKNKETPSMPLEEQKAGEEAKDEAEEEEEDEHKGIDSGSDAPVVVDASKDIDVKPSHKKSHNLLSGMGSKVKHSIAKVKKAITGKSSHHKSSSPK